MESIVGSFRGVASDKRLRLCLWLSAASDADLSRTLLILPSVWNIVMVYIHT